MQVIAELPVFSDVSLLEDAAVVYRALLRRSPQNAGELERSSGIEGERLQMAAVWLELRGVWTGASISRRSRRGRSAAWV